MRRKFLPIAAPLLALTLLAAACGDDATEETSSTAAPGASTDGDSGEACPGVAGCIPAGQPDVNGDGTVKIGVMSPGDTNDNGYYESFVVTARDFADANDWELIIVDKVKTADAAQTARDLCRQGVDMVALGAGELQDALPVAEEEICAESVWYMSGGAGVPPTPYFFQTNDDVSMTSFVAGYATGLAMEELGLDKAGFISGPEADFSVKAFEAWTAGIRKTIPDAETVATYTGDFNDAAKGQEAATAQLSQGVGILWPYLGGATDAVVKVGAEEGALSVTPGTDRCADADFGISNIFSPGEFFAAALKDFEAGAIKIGVARTFVIGKDDVPRIKVCDAVPTATEIQTKTDAFAKQVGSGEIDAMAEIAELK